LIFSLDDYAEAAHREAQAMNEAIKACLDS
jgi:hypothetical protein